MINKAFILYDGTICYICENEPKCKDDYSNGKCGKFEMNIACDMIKNKICYWYHFKDENELKNYFQLKQIDIKNLCATMQKMSDPCKN